jgi:hypothetical protein
LFWQGSGRQKESRFAGGMAWRKKITRILTDLTDNGMGHRAWSMGHGAKPRSGDRMVESFIQAFLCIQDEP